MNTILTFQTTMDLNGYDVIASIEYLYHPSIPAVIDEGVEIDPYEYENIEIVNVRMNFNSNRNNYVKVDLPSRLIEELSDEILHYVQEQPSWH